jgi:serine/threonine protein kinase
MAQVFRVLDLELEEEIALKVLSGSYAWKPESAEQFKQEIRLARRIVHRNVCRIYDFSRWKDLLFVTMELIHGETLADRIERNSLGALEQRLTIFRDILAGLRAAHAIGIVHQDMKPLNVMITPENRAVVMDFGIAREIGEAEAVYGDYLAGTPSYAAPERIAGEPNDHRGDIYSLGVMLFELIAGRVPFLGSPQAVLQAHLYQAPPRVKEFASEVPDAIDKAVGRMLEKEPGKRHSSVDEVLAELAEIRLGGVGRTVLFAMGDEHLRALMAHHLEAIGLLVLSTADGEQAIEFLLKEKPDLMLVDMEVPKIDGLRIVEMMRRMPHAADVPVYLLSAFKNPAYAAYAEQLDVKRVIERPVESRTLARELRDLMRAG